MEVLISGFFAIIISVAVFIMILNVLDSFDSKNKTNLKKRNEMESKLKSSTDFDSNQQIIGCDWKTGISIDKKERKICLIENNEKNLFQRIISYKNLLSAEIFEDGETITTTVRSSQIGNALIGSLALGGLGAVLGGLSGKTKTSENVEKVVLRLVVNDTKKPLYEICFLNIKTSKKDKLYQEAMQKVRHWHSLVEVLIKRADMEDKENAANNVVQISQGSIADEIKKLAELRDTGILSDVEFQQQKEKLLGGTPQVYA